MADDYKYFNGERMVGGTAAFLHYVYTVSGGPKNYSAGIIRDTLEVIDKRIEGELKRSQFKVL
jgi:hypothetical protein